MEPMRAASQALERLRKVEDLLSRSRPKATVKNRDIWSREDAFLADLQDALQRRDPTALRASLDAFRGLSHYFGAYCPSASELDKLLDELHAAVERALVALRQG
jgi:hypothetical protein